MSGHRRDFFGLLKPRWGVATGLVLVVALWEAGHAAYGPVVLPSPGETLLALWQMVRGGDALPAVLQTLRGALAGFLAAVVIGGALGLLAGLLEPLRAVLRPIATLMLGIPAVAWVVLALLWFGTDLAVPFTVWVTCAPIVFAAAAEGARSLDPGLLRMATAFRVPRTVLLADLYLPHMLSHLFPALATALALALKVAVMTELFSGAGGIGDGLATARAQVDTARAMAWILLLVGLLLALEFLLLEPLRRRLEPWRGDKSPLRPGASGS